MIKISSQSKQLSRVAQSLNRLLPLLTACVVLSACGGSAGGSDAGDIARVETGQTFLAQDNNQQDDVVQHTPVTDNSALQQDDLACDAEIDIAAFFLTESDRQWTCEVRSSAGTRFEALYFTQSGTASFANSGVWYWNRSVMTDAVNLASPGRPSMLMTDIGSSNTLLIFRTISEVDVEELYDCVLVSREIDSNI